jgi:hypothetical protein
VVDRVERLVEHGLLDLRVALGQQAVVLLAFELEGQQERLGEGPRAFLQRAVVGG